MSKSIREQVEGLSYTEVAPYDPHGILRPPTVEGVPMESAQVGPFITKDSGEDDGTLRTFATGATRDTSEGKPVHWRFQSALVEQRYGEYMHGKRIQSDGQLRSGDNWKKGMPIEVFFDSLSRHANDLRLIKEGFPEQATDQDIETVLCALKFNVDGMLHEIIRERLYGPRPE